MCEKIDNSNSVDERHIEVEGNKNFVDESFIENDTDGMGYDVKKKSNCISANLKEDFHKRNRKSQRLNISSKFPHDDDHDEYDDIEYDDNGHDDSKYDYSNIINNRNGRTDHNNNANNVNIDYYSDSGSGSESEKDLDSDSDSDNGNNNDNKYKNKKDQSKQKTNQGEEEMKFSDKIKEKEREQGNSINQHCTIKNDNGNHGLYHHEKLEERNKTVKLENDNNKFKIERKENFIEENINKIKQKIFPELQDYLMKRNSQSLSNNTKSTQTGDENYSETVKDNFVKSEFCKQKVTEKADNIPSFSAVKIIRFDEKKLGLIFSKVRIL